MRTLVVASGALAPEMAVQMMPAAEAANNTVLRKDNDAGASNTVIRKDEPPITGVPAPRGRDNNETQQGR